MKYFKFAFWGMDNLFVTMACHLCTKVGPGLGSNEVTTLLHHCHDQTEKLITHTLVQTSRPSLECLNRQTNKQNILMR